jgi:hypothetical protein
MKDWYHEGSSTPVKDALEVFTTGAKVNFKMWGEVLPVFGCNIDGEPQTVPVLFKNPQDKEKFRRRILDMIASGSLKEFVFVSEAWTVTAKNSDMSDVHEWMSKHGSLSGHPDRHEIVSVLYCSPSEEIQYTAAIDRSSIPPSLGDWEIHRTSSRFEISELGTRFQGLFALGQASNN